MLWDRRMTQAMNNPLGPVLRRLQGQPRPRPLPPVALTPVRPLPSNWAAPRTGGVQWR